MKLWPFNRSKKVDLETPVTTDQEPEKEKEKEAPVGILAATGFTTHATKHAQFDRILELAIPVTPANLAVTSAGHEGRAMDSACIDTAAMTPQYQGRGCGGMPPHMLAWYANQAWIGYQAIGILLQNWLINRACKIPAEDATRNGWKINGLSEEQTKRMQRFDKKRKVKHQASEQARYTRGFGIRISIFKVRSNDPDYYKKPFNLDSVGVGCYEGISQVDPIWCAPQFESQNVSDPSLIDFYEPDYWMIGNKLYHKSHLVITRYAEVPDILKPTYQFGGLSIPQLIWERVYAAERSANEGPQLLMTKRFNIIKTVLEAVGADPESLAAKYQEIAELRDNYGLFVMGTADGYEQHETALSDVDTVIMTEYQLVAGVAEMPVTKLLGTTPKGFQSTGEHETDNYNVLCAGIQEHHCDPLLERHYELACRHLWGEDYDIEIEWNPLDEPSEAELSDVQLKKAQTRQINQTLGNVSPQENREAIKADPESGYNLKDDENGGEEDDLSGFSAALHAAQTANALQQTTQPNAGPNEAPQPRVNPVGATQ